MKCAKCMKEATRMYGRAHEKGTVIVWEARCNAHQMERKDQEKSEKKKGFQW